MTSTVYRVIVTLSHHALLYYDSFRIWENCHKTIKHDVIYSTGHKYCNISTGVLVDFHMIHYTQINCCNIYDWYCDVYAQMKL